MLQALRNFFHPYEERDRIIKVLNDEAGHKFGIIHKALRETAKPGNQCDLDRVVAHIRAQKAQKGPSL
jgi:predicted Zn-dependent protease